MKRLLIVSSCQKRGTSIGLIGDFLEEFAQLDRSGYEICLFDINMYQKNHNPNDYKVDKYYNVPISIIDRLSLRIPKFRVWYTERKVISLFKKIMASSRFNLVVLYQVPPFSDKLASITHDNNCKILFLPWGSEVLRINKKRRERLKKAFDRVDFVSGIKNSNTLLAVKDRYGVPDEKFIFRKYYLDTIVKIKSLSQTVSRQEMIKRLQIPVSDFYIVCGYSGVEAQRHRLMIEALSQNKEFLPENYQILLPVTYGGQTEYIEELRSLCSSKGLKTTFLTNFLSHEHIAYLHLVTDLFIQIQPTDNGSAYMIEELFCGNQIITGKWLNYLQFEEFGVPYYLIDTPEDLADMLKKILTHSISQIVVPNKLKDLFDCPSGYRRESYWESILESL